MLDCAYLLFFFFFNIILLIFFFKDFLLILPYIVILTYLWVFFIKNNFFIVRVNPLSNDKLKNSNLIKKINFEFFLNWYLILFLYMFLVFFLGRVDFTTFWFNHLKVSNFLYNLIFFIQFIFLFLICFIKHIKNKNINYNIDYFLALFNINVFILIFFYSNTLYTFLFLLEVNSLLILYKFSVSRFWFKKNLFMEKNNLIKKNFSKNFLNMLFFQYWVNFFSSVLLMFSIFNLIFIFGSSEWFVLNFLCFYINNKYFINLILIYCLFFLGFFLKLGLTPIHLFKLEVYKGLPFLSIFFYTSYYFLCFFIYFVILIYINLNSFKNFWILLSMVIFLVGFVYVIFLLFDVNVIKIFFAYSTIINVLSFYVLIIVSF